jgi:hypothetical protein
MTAMVNKAFGTPPTPAEARVRLVPAQYRGQPAWFGRYGSYTVESSSRARRRRLHRSHRPFS